MGNKIGNNKSNMGARETTFSQYRSLVGSRCRGNVGRLLINRKPPGTGEHRGFHAAISRKLKRHF